PFCTRRTESAIREAARGVAPGASIPQGRTKPSQHCIRIVSIRESTPQQLRRVITGGATEARQPRVQTIGLVCRVLLPYARGVRCAGRAANAYRLAVRGVPFSRE